MRWQHGLGLAMVDRTSFGGGNRVYVGKRTKSNFYDSIMRHNAVVAGHVPSSAERAAFRASMNSYLGVMGHFDTRRLRRSMVDQHVHGWWKYAHSNGDVSKIVLRPDTGVSSVEY